MGSPAYSGGVACVPVWPLELCRQEFQLLAMPDV